MAYPGKPAPHFLLFNISITAATTSWLEPQLPGTGEEKHILAMLAKLPLSHTGKGEQVERHSSQHIPIGEVASLSVLLLARAATPNTPLKVR